MLTVFHMRIERGLGEAVEAVNLGRGLWVKHSLLKQGIKAG
jgi:hypothetical protein